MKFFITKKNGFFDKEFRKIGAYFNVIKDGLWSIEFKKLSGQRTGGQNRLYWAYLRLIGYDTGNDAEVLHGTFKAMFLVNREGKFPVVRSTTELDTAEFTKYLEKIKIFVADFGIVLPSVEEFEGRELSKNYLV